MDFQTDIALNLQARDLAVMGFAVDVALQVGKLEFAIMADGMEGYLVGSGDGIIHADRVLLGGGRFI